MRQRLFGTNEENQDLESLLKYNRDMQEKITENMLSLTKNMKEHALTANAIIKKDVLLLEKSDNITDQNTVKLKSESVKLEEHTKSTWRCWTWLMLAFVIVVFLSKFCVMEIHNCIRRKKYFVLIF